MKIKSACYIASKRIGNSDKYQQQSVSISRGSAEHTGLPEVVVAIEGDVIARFDGDSLLLWKGNRGNTSFTYAELEDLALKLYGENCGGAVDLGNLLVSFV